VSPITAPAGTTPRSGAPPGPRRATAPGRTGAGGTAHDGTGIQRQSTHAGAGAPLDNRIPEILARVDLASLVDRYAGQKRRVGARATYRCPSPDHDDHHPSFTVEAGRWRCWSACARSGDAIDLLMWLGRVDKGTAVECLAEMVGLGRPAKAPTQSPTTQALPAEAAERLLGQFLSERGWCPETAAELALQVVTDQRGRPRVRFPFRWQGETVGWQDRLLAEGEPRWLSSAGPIRCPYEVDRLARAHEVGALWVVEGISDCAAMIDAWPDAAVVGIPGASGLKPQWAQAFAGLVVYVVADADDAGQQMRASIDQQLGPLAAATHHVRVRDEHHDLDGWRRAYGDDNRFEAEIMRMVDGEPWEVTL